MELQVTIRNHYGKDFIYPYCEKAEIFAIIAGRRTLTENDVKWIKTLGYTFKVIQREL
jgi:histone H3/H4